MIFILYLPYRLVDTGKYSIFSTKVNIQNLPV